MIDNHSPGEQAAASHNSAQHLKELVQQLDEVLKLMRTQRDMLRKRGTNLPNGAMTSLRKLKDQSSKLAIAVEGSHRELRSLRALAETTALINSEQKTDDVLNQVMDTVIELTGAERGYIVLKNRESGVLDIRVARGIDQSTIDEGQAFSGSKTIVNKVADSGIAELTDNASSDPQFMNAQSIMGQNLRSILAVPLIVRDEVIGVVYCDNRVRVAMFSQHEKDILTAFANQAAVAIENARLFETSRMRLDEVTQIRDRMDNLFTSITNGVITCDHDDVVLISNDAASHILRQDALEGRSLHELLPENSEPIYVAVDHIKQNGGQLSFECEPIIEGDKRFWSVIASQLTGEDGQAGVVMVIEDVTDQKASESQLMEARRYLPVALVESMRDVDFFDVSIQERNITALFADVRGFTTFSENLEPEELMQVINRYLSLASDAINLFEGIVDKYMGDAVTGLFNTQLNPQADHAGRSIQAALQLVLDLHALHEVMPDNERLFYGIGIHTGPAVLGNVGGSNRKEFSALGEATNICKYLQEQAGPGEIIISEQTLSLVEEQFECEPVTELARPKKDYEDIVCYRVVRRKKGGPSMFIDEELLALLAQDDMED